MSDREVEKGEYCAILPTGVKAHEAGKAGNVGNEDSIRALG